MYRVFGPLEKREDNLTREIDGGCLSSARISLRTRAKPPMIIPMYNCQCPLLLHVVLALGGGVCVILQACPTTVLQCPSEQPGPSNGRSTD
jgi:hypothetical protein